MPAQASTIPQLPAPASHFVAVGSLLAAPVRLTAGLDTTRVAGVAGCYLPWGCRVARAYSRGVPCIHTLWSANKIAIRLHHLLELSRVRNQFSPSALVKLRKLNIDQASQSTQSRWAIMKADLVNRLNRRAADRSFRTIVQRHQLPRLRTQNP